MTNVTNVSAGDVEQLERFAERNIEGTKLAEVLTGVPPVFQRGVIYVAGGVVLLTFLLLYVGKVHVVVTATGKIVPEGESIMIQSLEKGVVREVPVQPGDRVLANAPLVRLDLSRSGLNVASLTRKEQILTEEVRMLRDSVRGVSQLLDAPERGVNPSAVFAPSISSAVHELARAAIAMREANSVQRVGFPEKKKQMAQEIELAKRKIELLEKNFKASGDEIAGEEASLARKKTKLDEFRRLATERGLYSKLEVEEEEERFRIADRNVRDLRRQRDERELELSNERLRLAELQMKFQTEQAESGKSTDLAAVGYREKLSSLRSSFEQLQQQLTKQEAELASTSEELQLARGQMQFSSISSPVAGTVTELKVRNAGEVVSEGQAVAVVVPEGVPLVIDAEIPNKDIGFVRPGTMARIKVDAFPFQRFGTVDGKVLKVFNNAGTGDKFAVRIALLQNTIRSGDETIRLFPGLTVHADILTRRQRLLAILFDRGDG
jgi:multidrug efflux pump subunit AcrA (membrane-fusion protein)